jgi:hypothetical protein
MAAPGLLDPSTNSIPWVALEPQHICVSPAAAHLLDLRHVLLLVPDFPPRELLERNITPFAERNERPLEVDPSELVSEQLEHYAVYRVMMSPCEFPNSQRQARSEGHFLPSLCRM